MIKNKVTPSPFLEMTGIKRGCYLSGFLFLLTFESCNIQSKKRVRGLAWISPLCFWPWLEPPMNKIDGNSVKVRMKLNSKNAKCLGWTARAKPSLTVRPVKQKQTSLIFTPISQRTAVALTLWREYRWLVHPLLVQPTSRRSQIISGKTKVSIF